MAQSSSIEIPVSTELLNCLRSFDHEHHAYKKEFLETLDSILLLCFQKTQCVSSIDELSFEAVFLGVHYYLSLIINIGELINRYDEDRQVTEMNLRAINSTNIFNIHSLSNALQNQRKISQRKSSTQELNLSAGNSQKSVEVTSARFLEGFRLYLTKEDVQVDGSLYLSCDMLVRAMKSNGRINMEFVSFICHELNQALGLSLSHYLASSESNSDLSLNVDSKDTYTCNDFYTHMTLFLQEKDQELLLTALNNLESKVISAIKYLDYESQALLKRLFVALLGHNSPIIRERSAIYLNMINDGVEWVLEVTQKTRVATVGDEFIISHTLDSSSIELSDPMFLLHASPFGVNNKGNPVFSMHKPDIRVDSDTQELTVNLGKFSKPGFYHWKLINVCGAAIQGKFVVHPKGTRDLGVHEVSAKDSLVLVKENIVHYMRTGINCICVKGDISSKEEEIRSLVQAAKEINIKVVVDFKSTLNADELTNEFGDVVLKEINENNEELGLAKNQAKEMFLNMRRREAWDLVIEQAVNLVQKYGLSGLSLENVQNWPQVFDIDQREMAKNEVDGRQKYTLEENFFGDIISSTQNDPDYSFTSTNPFLAELCNRMWQKFPSLVLIGEITSSQDLETKQRSLIGSGIIPKLHQNSPFIAEIFGKKINKHGVYVNSSPSSDNLSNLLQQMNEETLPSGAIIIQSISTYSLPHPLYIFERGIFAFIDMMFFLPQIPSTCMNEIKGHCYKYNTAPSQRSQNITPFFDDTELEESDQDRIINDTEGVLTSVEECIKAQEKFQKKFGIEYGLTPQRIQSHYEKRRHMRRNYEALRAGKMIPLTVESEGETSNKVFSFVRATSKETLVVAVNFNEFDVRFNVDTKKVLQHIVSEMDQEGIMQCVVKIQDFGKNSYPSYYTAFEFLFGKIDLSLKPYTSLVWSIDIICNDEELYNKTLVYSLQRVKYQTMRNEKVEGHEVIELLTSTVKNTNNIQEFACKLDYINKNFLKPAGIYISDLLNTVKDFQQNSALSEKLFAFCTVLKEYFPQASEDDTASSSNGSDMHAFKTTEITFMHDDFLPSELVDIRNDFRSSIEIARDVLDHNTLGPIALISPELGRWSTVGGLGVMVDELSIGLAQLGEDVICVSPYYDKNRKGETNYLAKDPDGIRYVFNIEVEINNEKHVLGIHYGVIKGVKLYFIHHAMIFPHIYVGGDARYTMLQISLLAKASLQLLSVIDKLPSLVVTNDWFTGLVAAYAKNGHFEKVFSQTKFLHIIHNLDTAYEGRQYPSYEEGNLENIHGLPSYLLVNPQWFDTIINPSRCAILASDKWTTVSATYKNEILTKSDLADVLVVSPNPFAVSNGILKENRLSLIKKVCNGDHLKAKEIIQKKYFKFPRMDNSYAIFAFVGRITYQKGVIHILEAIEELLVKSNFSIQFIIGGMASPNDPYGSACAALMKDLMSAYPKNVWAGPYEFFTDGTLLNVGADFALMPSIFEPGGIVQHEFFVGSTPVIASQTGGLADTVFEFNVEAEEGNGFTMESSNKQNIIDAVTRACEVYNQPSKYQALRKQAFKSVIDVESVAKAWNREFYKLFGKVFMEAETIRPHIEAIDRTFSDNKIECRPTFDSIIQQKILGEIKPKQVCHVSRYAESEKVSNKDFDVAYYEERRSEQEQDKYRHKLSLDEKVCLVNTEVVDQSVTCSMEVA